MPTAGGDTLAGTWTPGVTLELDGTETDVAELPSQPIACGEGYYQDSNFNNFECSKCDENQFPTNEAVKCPEGTTRTSIHLSNGYWRALTHDSNDEGLGSVFVRECYGLPYPENYACPYSLGNFTGNARCKAGHTGPLCGLCRWEVGVEAHNGEPDNLWVMNTETFQCEQCLPKNKQLAIIVLSLLFLLAFGAAIVSIFFAKKLGEYLMIKNENGESNLQMLQAFRNRVQEWLDNNKDYFKVILNFFQIITQHLGGAINIDWPQGYTRLMAKLNFVNFNVSGLISQACLFKPASYWGALMGMTLGPIALSVLLAVYAIFVTIKAKATGMEQSVVDETVQTCCSAFFALTYLVFPGTSLAVFRGFACDIEFDYDKDYTEGVMDEDGYWYKTKTKANYDPSAGTDGRGSYLQYDYGIDCNGSDYIDIWRTYCIIMVFIYPIGIPLMYAVSVYLNRQHVNPDPVYLCADVLLDGDGEFTSKINVQNSDGTMTGVPFEVRRLAITLSGLYDDVSKLTAKAEALHEEAVARMTAQALNRNALEEQRSAQRRPSSMDRAGAKARSSLYKLKDKVQVPDAWEDFLPAYASIIHNYENSIEIMEQDMISMYRKHNPKAAMYKFLCDAYEPQYYYWESIECLRRLALTGLLVFIAPPLVDAEYVDNAQIIVAGVICLASLQLYVRCAPYMDDQVDSISTIAQLMTFTQLFGALLISVQVDNVDYDPEVHANCPTDSGVPCETPTQSLVVTIIPAAMATGLLVGTAVLVPFWDMFTQILDFFGSTGGLIIGSIAFFFYNKVLQKKAEEADQEAEDRANQRAEAIETLEASRVEEDGEDEEYDYGMAKLEAVQIFTDKVVTKKCLIKDDNEKDLVKAWLGLHVARLVKGQQDGELDDDFLIPPHTAHKTAEQLHREAMVCVTPANVEALLLAPLPHNREPLVEEKEESDVYARTSEFEGDNPLKKTSIEI